MKKILITGGAGFIGFHLAKKLAEDANNRISIADNLARGRMDTEMLSLIDKNNVEFIECDLATENGIKKISGNYDFIFHMAALVGVKHCMNDPERVLRTNINSTFRIVDHIKEKGCGKVFFASTSEVYAGAYDYDILEIPTAENAPHLIPDIMNPRFSYAASKSVCEQTFIFSAQKYGFDFNIGRFHNVYGPRMGYAHVIPEMIKRLTEGENPFKIYGHDQSRAFCYIDDASDAISKISFSDTKNEIFHIGNDEEETVIAGLASKIFDICDIHPETEKVSAPPGSVKRRCPDISKLRELTGFKTSVSLDIGLETTCEWYIKDLKENKAWE